jgi:hypothetical protein
MIQRAKSKLLYWLALLVCDHVSIGGQCAYCKRWIDDCLAPTAHRVVVCDRCLQYKKGE